MGFTIDQYNKLKAAYATGAEKIQYGDKVTEFRTRDEIKQILREMEIELNIGTKRKSRNIKSSYTKGT